MERRVTRPKGYDMNGFMKRLLHNFTQLLLSVLLLASFVLGFSVLTSPDPTGFGGAAFAASKAAPEKAGKAGLETTTGAETITITKSSATLYAAPAWGAKQVGIAYGNDRFQVRERKSGWAKVKWKGGRTAWAKESDFGLTFIATAKLAEENRRGRAWKNRAASATQIARNRSHGANGSGRSRGMARGANGNHGKQGKRGLIAIFSTALRGSFAGGPPRRAGVMSMATGAMVAYRGGKAPRAAPPGKYTPSSRRRLGRVSGTSNGLNQSNPAKMLARAKGLQVVGKRREARKGYLDLIRRHPGTNQFYEAVRQMNYYYPLGEFPPTRNGRVNQRSMDLAEGKLGELLIGEGNTLLAEKRPLEAVAVFEMALLNGGDIWEGSTKGLRKALGAYLSDPRNKVNRREYQMAKDTFDHYFPGRIPPDSRSG